MYKGYLFRISILQRGKLLAWHVAMPLVPNLNVLIVRDSFNIECMQFIANNN